MVGTRQSIWKEKRKKSLKQTNVSNKCAEIPFICNDNGEEDGTVEDDIIDRVEKLGEDDGVQFTVVVKWPLEY